MGMYDYLGDEQVKIFYLPIFSSKDTVTGKPSTWHSGGRLISYNKRSKLPLVTGYYKYPQNFIVFDFSYDCEDVWIIKNGKFKIFKKYTELVEKDLGEAVFNYYGSELNITKLQDFYDLKREAKETRNIYDRKEEEFFPDGIFDTIRNKPEYYDSVKAEWDKVHEDTFGKFNDKWFKKDKYKLEKQLGEYLECYFYLGMMKDGEAYEWHNPMSEFLNCKQATKDFINENLNIVEKYIAWQECSEDHEKNIRDIINEIML